MSCKSTSSNKGQSIVRSYCKIGRIGKHLGHEFCLVPNFFNYEFATSCLLSEFFWKNCDIVIHFIVLANLFIYLFFSENVIYEISYNIFYHFHKKTAYSQIHCQVQLALKQNDVNSLARPFCKGCLFNFFHCFIIPFHVFASQCLVQFCCIILCRNWFCYVTAAFTDLKNFLIS